MTCLKFFSFFVLEVSGDRGSAVCHSTTNTIFVNKTHTCLNTNQLLLIMQTNEDIVAYCPKEYKNNCLQSNIFAVYAAKMDKQMVNDPHWKTDGLSMCV